MPDDAIEGALRSERGRALARAGRLVHVGALPDKKTDDRINQAGNADEPAESVQDRVDAILGGG
ncbi:MAG: hypothetical protein AAGF92_24170 [Myxococcota bacterium]